MLKSGNLWWVLSTGVVHSLSESGHKVDTKWAELMTSNYLDASPKPESHEINATINRHLHYLGDQ